MTNAEAKWDYRNKHRHCKFCKYCNENMKGERCGVLPFDECLIKDKIISCGHIAKICKYYKIKL